jgi:hypothetical protein
MNKKAGAPSAPAVEAAAAPAQETKAKKEKKEKKSTSGGGVAAGGAGGGGGGYTMEEVGKHVTKGDCWVVLDGNVLNVTTFLSQHPGGELAILTFAGKDATEEFNMIHPPDVVGKYAPDAIIGKLGGGGGGAPAAEAVEGDDDSDEDSDSDEDDDSDAAEETGPNLDKGDGVGNHHTWGHKDGQINWRDRKGLPGFLSRFVGGLWFDNRAHNAARKREAKKAAKAKKLAAKPGKAPWKKDDGGLLLANHHAWGHLDNAANWRMETGDELPGVFIINVGSYLSAAWYLWLGILYETCATIFSAKLLQTSGDRLGLTRSAILLVLFIVIHAVGNLHVFKGPDDFNGYGYFYVRLYWTGFGLPANIVEEYILLSVLLHVYVGLRRTWDGKLGMAKSSTWSALLSPMNSPLNLAVSGLALLTFMTIHLFQFRFGDTDQFGPYYVRPPPYLINFWGITKLDLFWTDDTSVERVGVRDIYKLEYQIFQNSFWCFFYIFSVCIFMFHACIGWKKAVGSVLGIPRGHQQRVNIIGYLIMVSMGAVYISFPLFCMFVPAFNGEEMDINVGRTETPAVSL